MDNNNQQVDNILGLKIQNENINDIDNTNYFNNVLINLKNKYNNVVKSGLDEIIEIQKNYYLNKFNKINNYIEKIHDNSTKIIEHNNEVNNHITEIKNNMP